VFPSKGIRLCIDFSSMFQFRPETPLKIRHVRRFDDVTALWYWQDASKFRQFSDANCKSIEDAFQAVWLSIFLFFINFEIA
jgi:hypothetical protein